MAGKHHGEDVLSSFGFQASVASSLQLWILYPCSRNAPKAFEFWVPGFCRQQPSAVGSALLTKWPKAFNFLAHKMASSFSCRGCRLLILQIRNVILSLKKNQQYCRET